MAPVVTKPRIFVVEDEVIVARDIRMQLLELGFDPIGHATHGEDAVIQVRAMRPDLVLMDIRLAGAMDGITAARAIRDEFHLPVVFLTAFANEEILSRAKLTEPYGYILKPFSERELRTALEMGLYRHQIEVNLRASIRQSQALARRVLEVQETERRRVALELHDELGPTLTALKINLQAHERFEDRSQEGLNAENIRIVENALQQVRRLALALRPSMLDDLGLAPALRWIAEQTSFQHDVTVQFHAVTALARFAPELETACFRIVQEALTNVIRHARAQQVHITLDQDDKGLTLSVQDDGCGFDVEAMHARAAAGESIGVLGMQERAALIGGQLDIDSATGKGSTVRLLCPLRLGEALA